MLVGSRDTPEIMRTGVGFGRDQIKNTPLQRLIARSIVGIRTVFDDVERRRLKNRGVPPIYIAGESGCLDIERWWFAIQDFAADQNLAIFDSGCDGSFGDGIVADGVIMDVRFMRQVQQIVV